MEKNYKSRQEEFFSKIINSKNFTYRILLNYLEKYLYRNSYVIDLGCGQGNIALFSAKKTKKVRGIDISEKNIEIAKEKAKLLHLDKKTSFLVGNIEKTENQTKEEADLVILTEVIEHLRKGYDVFQKIHGLLKKNGILFLSTPSKNAPLLKIKKFKKRDKTFGHVKRYSVNEIKKYLEEFGFKIIEVHFTEGPFRNFLFISPLGKIPLKFANRFEIVSDLFTFIDNISLKLFGSSQIIIVAQKK